MKLRARRRLRARADANAAGEREVDGEFVLFQ